jgi:hypothetical protein
MKATTSSTHAARVGLSFFGWLCLLGSDQGLAAYHAPVIHPSRRTLLGQFVGGMSGSLAVEENAHAAPGALLPPPRTLQGPLVPLLLNNEYLPSCIPVQVLSEFIAKQQGNGSPVSVARSIAETAMDYRTKASRSFYARAPWSQPDVTDQYYFDLSAYALWRTAADRLPNYTDRDAFVRMVGRRLYQNLQDRTIRPPVNKSVVASEPIIVAILQSFQSSNFCKGFRLGTDVSKNQNVFFDSLDDEALQSGASVYVLVSILEPATLGASLQITGEQSRFAPDLVGPTLAACWESMGIRSSWEVFFVDPDYRSNPKYYNPNEKLLQFTLTLESTI